MVKGREGWAPREYYKFKCPEGHLHFSQTMADNCHFCRDKGTGKLARHSPGVGYAYRNVKDLFKEELVPAKENIRGSLDEQIKLFEDNSIIPNAHVKMGLFYEMMTAALFGGKVIAHRTMIDIRKTGDENSIVPDVISNRLKHVFESKACQQGSKLNFMDFQINHYNQLCILHKFDIYYSVWRHNFKGIHKYKGRHQGFILLLVKRHSGWVNSSIKYRFMFMAQSEGSRGFKI